MDQPSRQVVLVEDDADFRQALVDRLLLEGIDVRPHASAEAALRSLTAGFAGVVVTDLRMPGMDGRQLLARVRAMDPDLPVILITGHGDVADAVAAMHDGAYDFVSKPFTFERLSESLDRALEKRALVLENRRLAILAEQATPSLPLAGASPAITRLRGAIAQLADARTDVLIEGETGVGKEAVARALHNGGGRRHGPFVAVNCGALPEGLIESELFGHELGAFAGALRRRVGHVERSSGGTLFLDEVESIPLPVQVKFLRVPEEREVSPIGANEPRVLDLRVIAATKADLAEAVSRGAFREDLFHRLDVVRLRVPPLRGRPEDTALLFAHLVRRAADRHGVAAPPMTDAVRRRLLEGEWRGNIRELANYAERLVLGLDQEAERPTQAIGGLRERMDQLEAAILSQTLADHHGDVGAACDELRLPRKTFYDRLARHGLKPADFR